LRENGLPEYKFAGCVGLLKRRDLVVEDVVHIRKEANNIDDQVLDIRKAQMFRDKAVIIERILALPQKKAEEYGVDRRTFRRIKQRIQEDEDFNLNTVAVRRLLSKIFEY
jgi:hypothetical protein